MGMCTGGIPSMRMMPRLHLVDADRLSVSNMNRIVGASYKDALEERPKAECLKEHFLTIFGAGHPIFKSIKAKGKSSSSPNT